MKRKDWESNIWVTCYASEADVLLVAGVLNRMPE